MTTRYLAALVAAVLLLSACSPKQAPGPQLPAVITLNILATNDPVIDSMIQAFLEIHPNIRVSKTLHTLQSPSSQELGALLAAGQLDLTVPMRQAAVSFLPLDPLIQKSRFPLEALNPASEQLRSDGVLYTLPLRVQPPVLLYNVERFEQAGIPLPRPGWTWEEFRDAAARLAVGEGESRRWGFSTMEMMNLVELMVEQQTGRPWWEAEEPALKQAVQFFTAMIFTDRSAPPHGEERVTVP